MKALFALTVLVAVLAMPSDPAARAVVSVPARADHDWIVDPVHSSVVFKVMHAGIANFYGGFDTITGEVSLDPESPESGKVKLVIPIESIHTRDPKRDGHLKGPDFFNGKENPEITFASTKIEALADGKYEVTGDLEMAGVTQPVTITVDKTGEGDFYGPRIGYETTFGIQRSKFGMNYGLAKNVLGDDVTLTVSLELTKPK